MAHLQKKKDIWYLIDKSSGKAQWIKLGPIKHHEAKTVLARYQTDKTYLKLDLLPDNPIKFKDLATQYLEYAKTVKAPITVDGEKDLLNTMGKSVGEKQARSLKLEDLEALLNGNPNYVRLKIAALRSLFKFAIDRRIFQINLAKELKRPKIPILPPKHVDPKIIEKVFKAMTPQTSIKFMILFYTGMRPSEMLRLQGQDIDLKNRSLIVRYSKTNRFRMIPIHKDLVFIFEEILKGKEKEDYLFPGVKGPHQITIRSALRRACKEAKVKGITPYVFRHQFATMVLDKTRDLRLVQQLLGHSSIQITTRYATALDHRLREAVDLL